MNKSISKENVSTHLEYILKKNFDIKDGLTEKNKNIPLTEAPFMFSSFQLYELLMLVEENYQRYYTVGEITENGFSTFNDVVRLILT